MMRRYLSGTGVALAVDPRLFVRSEPVRRTMADLQQQVVSSLSRDGRVNEVYTSETFYMGDPNYFDSFVGLYFGHIELRTQVTGAGALRLRWRAEVPWKWPSYEEIHREHGRHHAQSFPLPNARSLLQGSEYCLHVDDGLGGHLTDIGLAKPFLVYSEWEEASVIQPK